AETQYVRADDSAAGHHAECVQGRGNPAETEVRRGHRLVLRLCGRLPDRLDGLRAELGLLAGQDRFEILPRDLNTHRDRIYPCPTTFGGSTRVLGLIGKNADDLAHECAAVASLVSPAGGVPRTEHQA